MTSTNEIRTELWNSLCLANRDKMMALRKKRETEVYTLQLAVFRKLPSYTKTNRVQTVIDMMTQLLSLTSEIQNILPAVL